MRDIKVVNVGTSWVLLNPTKESVFFQSMEGALSFYITDDNATPSIGINGYAFPSLEYRTSSGGAYVWIKAAITGRVLAGVFSSPGERVLFEGSYSTLQQAFQFTQQTEFPELVTALANVIETDTTHPVAASVIYELGTTFGQALQGLAPLSSPAFTDIPTAPTALPGTNDTQLATTAYADDAAATAEQNANDYADGLVTGLWDDRGAFDASPGNYPSSGGSGLAGAVLKGDIWTISVPGTIGTDVLEVGDTLRALVDNPDGEWAVGQNNIGWVPENVTKKVTTLAAPNNTDYPTTQAVADGLSGKAATGHGHAIGDVTGLQTALNGKEPSLPANVGSTKFLREDRTFQNILDVILTGLNTATNAAVVATDSILVAIGKLQAQAAAVNTTLFTSRGTGNTISAGCEAVNCTNTVVQGTNNIAINCANLTIAAAQKEAQFFNVRANTELNNLLLPRGSLVHATSNRLSVESFFRIVKLSNNNPALVQDTDGVKPAFTIGADTPPYYNTAVHEITVVSGLGPAMAVRRVMCRAGFSPNISTLGTDIDTGLVFNITENSGRLDIAITGAGGYAGSQLTLQVMVRSFYGAL